MGTACSALRRRANAKVHRVLPRRPLLRYQRTSVGRTPLVGGTIRVRVAELPTVAVGTGDLSRQQGAAQVVPGGRSSTSRSCRRRSWERAKSGERLLNWGTDGAFYGVCRESLAEPRAKRVFHVSPASATSGMSPGAPGGRLRDRAGRPSQSSWCWRCSPAGSRRGR